MSRSVDQENGAVPSDEPNAGVNRQQPNREGPAMGLMVHGNIPPDMAGPLTSLGRQSYQNNEHHELNNNPWRCESPPAAHYYAHPNALGMAAALQAEEESDDDDEENNEGGSYGEEDGDYDAEGEDEGEEDEAPPSYASIFGPGPHQQNGQQPGPMNEGIRDNHAPVHYGGPMTLSRPDLGEAPPLRTNGLPSNSQTTIAYWPPLPPAYPGEIAPIHTHAHIADIRQRLVNITRHSEDITRDGNIPYWPNLQPQMTARAPAQMPGFEIPANPPPPPMLTKFEMVAAHTAKCDICNMRNEFGMSRCLACGWQTCHNCTLGRGCRRVHNAGGRIHYSPIDEDQVSPPKAKPNRRMKQASSTANTPAATEATSELDNASTKHHETAENSVAGPSTAGPRDNSKNDNGPVDNAGTGTSSDSGSVVSGARSLYALCVEAWDSMAGEANSSGQDNDDTTEIVSMCEEDGDDNNNNPNNGKDHESEVDTASDAEVPKKKTSSGKKSQATKPTKKGKAPAKPAARRTQDGRVSKKPHPRSGGSGGKLTER